MAGWRSTLVVSAVVVGLAAAVVPATAKTAKAPAPVISVLSSRADLVSDGQALVAVGQPARSNPARVHVTLNGRDVSRSFALRPNGKVEAVVTGLTLGRNVLVASYPGGRRAQITLTNHRRGGPLFTGPQLQPWSCPAHAIDAQCDQPVQYTYLYKSTNKTKAGLQPYDPAAPPTDVATTTTQTGKVVPFIVRQELGYRDRDQYKILTLFAPKTTWSRWSPPPTWNHKVLVTGGGGCGGDYGTGNAPLADFSGTIPTIPGRDDSYVDALGMGFAVMTSALDNTGHNCNVAVEAEALMMVKEHLIEQYGDVRYTIGTGCSGGSIVQHTIANAYPGAVYDGLVVTCAYPDTFTAGAQFADYHLLRHYFESPQLWGTGVAWTPAQWAAVEGRPDPVNAIVADEALFKGAINPIGTCVAASKAYNPQTNPGGVRCDILDYMKTLLGLRPASVWSPMEKAAGHGFAGVPFSNVGIEYGLDALRQGVITPEMFVDLNEKIGGLDMNMQPEAQRLAGDDASVANAYRTGLVDETDNLNTVAIVDHAGPDPGAAHDFAHTWWIRDRLDNRHGTHANQVLWFGLTPLIGDITWPTQALLAVDEWLGKVEADHSNRPLAQKIATDRPADVHDRCNTVPGVHLDATDGVCLPDGATTHYGTPREVAGGSNLNDVLKCTLEPVPSDGYGAVGLSPDQLDRLRKVFPDGVCDWGQKGIGQQPVVPWLTYQTAKGAVIYGGAPMPKAPRSKVVASG
ncbi:MAG TPA: DUF6351 family protein [Mycobacteriales bacterium]|nr:DUF6351 family protein [Mycobacteriales bacterium]